MPDPFTDPFGAALLAFAAVAAVLLLHVVAAWLGRRSTTVPNILSCLFLFLFLWTAGLGAWTNVNMPGRFGTTKSETVHRSGPADAGTSGPEAVHRSGPADAGTSGPEAEAEPEPEPEADTDHRSGPADAGASGAKPSAEADTDAEPGPEADSKAEGEPEAAPSTDGA
jgi:hypothetical protein